MAYRKWKKKHCLIARYRSSADSYDTLYASEQNGKVEAALQIMDLNDSDIVLDAGCGTGFLFQHAVRSVSVLVGLDLSRELIRIAARKARNLEKGSAISLIRADADYMPFQEGTFDKIFAITLLQNMPDLSRTFREMRRIAKNSTIIVVTGLKKSFSQEEFAEVLRTADLQFSMIEAKEQIHDHIAVCSKK